MLDGRPRQAWREREWNGRVIRHKTCRSFIETPPMEGCGWPLDRVEKLIEHDVDTLRMWEAALKEKPGPKSVDNVNRFGSASKGNSKAYAVSRLHREAPELYEEVKEGRLSANAAAIKAGFRKKPSPFEQITRLIPKLTDEQRHKLKELLS